MKTVLLWVFNAVLYTTVICLMFYSASAPYIHDYDVYTMGTIVFMAMVHALQAKVLFLHCNYTWLNALVMAISLAGMFIFILVYGDITGEYMDYDIYYVGNVIFSSSYFWFFSVFTVPIFCILIDFLGQALWVFLWPTSEILFRENELKV